MSNNLDSLKLKQQLWEKEAVKQLLIVLKSEIEHEITINSIAMNDDDKPLIANELRGVFHDLEQTLPKLMHMELVDRESVVKLNDHFGLYIVPIALQRDLSLELGKIANIYDSFGTNGFKPSFGTTRDGKPYYVFKFDFKHRSLLSKEYRDIRKDFHSSMNTYLKLNKSEKLTAFTF
ncbi:hypothetical protein [Photobacterium phosphoreum]|uniref:hypothetical protein n=1 Tax=Photobacterium phosphoreum TaxID=659 RepID=UPI000D17783D|nr:hypothetical protein [Photobacterium phosphoreum]PSU58376.1 hypothetical protein CTM75_16955 [Photobacterium phosphoreum]